MIYLFLLAVIQAPVKVCARAIHQLSARKPAPFIALNCAGLSEQFIESELFGHVKGAFTDAKQPRDGAVKRAQYGTLFLDEISELPLPLQAKLLRFTENFRYKKLGSDSEQQADIRLLSASNKNLKLLVQHNKFREDLYYRLQVGHINMPDLKDRQNDIIDIALYYFVIIPLT